MEKQRDIAMTVRRVTFAEAEEIDNEYYAGLSELERLKILMELRSMLNPGYNKIKKVVSKWKLNEEKV